MTPEQLAIKNVGKQVKFSVNLFTIFRVIVMSLQFLNMATICRKKKLWVNFMTNLELVFLFHLYVLYLQDPKRHLEEHVDVLMTSNIVQCLAAMLDTVVFQ